VLSEEEYREVWRPATFFSMSFLPFRWRRDLRLDRFFLEERLFLLLCLLSLSVSVSVAVSVSVKYVVEYDPSSISLLSSRYLP
jgi:hypothetical protein